MRLACKLYLWSAVTLLTACSHPLEIVGEGDIIDGEGTRGCTFEQFNTPTGDGTHPCQNIVILDYHADYSAVAKPGWRFVGWDNYCEGGEAVCSFHVGAEMVFGAWGKVMPPLIAHFERVAEPGEFLNKVLATGATAAIFRASDNSFLLTTSAGTESPYGALLRMDSITGQVTTLATLPYRAHVLELSADEETLYIAYSDKNQLDVFDLQSAQFNASINLVATDGTSGLIARSISASPTDPDVIAVSLGWGTNSALASLYKNGVRHGVSTEIGNGSVWRGEVEFSPDGALLYGEGITTIVVTAAGLGAKTVRYDGLSTPQFVGDRVFSYLTALDPTTLSPIGFYRPQDYTQDIGVPEAYAPDLDFVFYYFPGYDRLIVNDIKRFTPVADYSLEIDGEYAGMEASAETLLLFTDTSVYLIAQDDIEPMYTEGCPTHSLVAENGKPYLRLDCPIADVAYDSFRNKVYASVSASLGQNGNSIAVVDAQTGVIEQFIPAVSEPQHIALNADGTKLFISSEFSSFIHRLDLATQKIDGKYWLGTWDTQGAIGNILAHPYDPALFVVAHGSSGYPSKLTSVSNLAVTGSFTLGSSYPHAEFASNGNLVASYESFPAFTRVIRELDVSPSGFASVKAGQPQLADEYLSFTTHSDSLIFLDGTVLDRATLAHRSPLPFAQDVDWTPKIAVDRDSETLFHAVGRYGQPGYLKLDRYDLASSSLSGEIALTDSAIYQYKVLSLMPVDGGKVLLHAQEMGTSWPTYLHFLQDSDFDLIVP